MFWVDQYGRRLPQLASAEKRHADSSHLTSLIRTVTAPVMQYAAHAQTAYSA